MYTGPQENKMCRAKQEKTSYIVKSDQVKYEILEYKNELWSFHTVKKLLDSKLPRFIGSYKHNPLTLKNPVH